MSDAREALFPSLHRRSFWRTTSAEGRTRGWHGRVSVGRAQVGFNAYRHHSFVGAHRWVFQPFLIVDQRPT